MTRFVILAATLVVASCSVQRIPPAQSADDHLAHMNAADVRAPDLTAAAQQGLGVPGIPASARTAEARIKASPRHAEWVKVAYEPGSADSLMAWIVYPSTRTKAPVVVVVHEIFGLSTWVRSVADQVAADGFIAIAPDFLSRVRGGPSSVELPSDTARALIGGVSAVERNRIINAAANYAMMQPSAEQRYAVIGYCWGGGTTFTYAASRGVKGFSGGVAYYGLAYLTGGGRATATTPATPVTVNADSLAKINVPMMLLNGSKDMRIGAAMPAVDSIMKANKKDYTGINYEGAVHGFLRTQDDPRAQNPDEAEEQANLTAAKDAWPKTVAFLRKHLGVK